MSKDEQFLCTTWVQSLLPIWYSNEETSSIPAPTVGKWPCWAYSERVHWSSIQKYLKGFGRGRAILTLGKSLSIYILQKIGLFCTIYYRFPREMVWVELGGVCENILAVRRPWTSKKAIAMLGVCYLKYEIKLTDTSLWLLPMVADGTTNQRLKPKTFGSTTSLPNTLPLKHLLRCFPCHSHYSHHNTTWISAHVPTDFDPSRLDSALSTISCTQPASWPFIKHLTRNGLSLLTTIHGPLTAHGIIFKCHHVTYEPCQLLYLDFLPPFPCKSTLQ